MSSHFEKGGLFIQNSTHLEWIRIRTDAPRGIVFAPPLIGGDLSMQVMTYRRLIQKGYDLISFSYSGHRNSSGKFSLGATTRDTFAMLDLVQALCKKEKVPLLGIASCYSAIPCLYAAQKLAEPFERLVLINALPKLGPGSVIMSFLTYYMRIAPNHSEGPMGGIGIKPYLEFLFPGIIKSRDNFGVLERRRTRLLKTVTEFFTINPLKGVKLRQTPVLCLYATRDRLLEIYDTSLKEKYEENIRELCPRARFRTLDGGHYVSLKNAREEALKYIDDFFNSCPNEATVSGFESLTLMNRCV